MADSILDQILSGVKKLPGNILGGPTDISNILVNSAKALYGVVGKETGLLKTDQLPDLEDNPFMGSKYINQKFGLGESKGSIDDITQMVGSLVTPGGVAKAMILPALAIKDASVVEAATRFLKNGANPNAVFKASGIYQGTEASAPLKAVLPDTNASLTTVGSVIRTSEKNRFYDGPVNLQSTTVKLPSDFQGKLPDVLNHPELFEKFPALRDVNVRAGTEAGGGSYLDNTIKVGPAIGTKGQTDLSGKSVDINAEENFLSVLLHETQHAVQDYSGFMMGGNPGMFMRNELQVHRAKDLAKQYGQPNLGFQADRILDEAYSNYLNIGGELEAQIVQAQRKNPNLLKENPAELAIRQAGGKDKIINPANPPIVDNDIQSIIDYYTR